MSFTYSFTKRAVGDLKKVMSMPNLKEFIIDLGIVEVCIQKLNDRQDTGPRNVTKK